ncbi:MAG: class I SAM-dependent methyltransferase [Pseudomonadota bacterium]
MTANPFDAGGAAYAAGRPTYPPALADALADAAPAEGHALDVGCGTGQLAALLAERFARVTATDPSGSQLAAASRHPRIAYREEPAERIGLPDASVDLIAAAQAAHWFDLPSFYAEARRVARPGGLLALVTYGVPEAEGPAKARFEDFYWREIHEYWPAERAHVEQGYASLDFPFEEISFPPLEIVREWSAEAMSAYVATWSATRRAREAGAGGVVERFMADLATLVPAGEAMRVRWPIHVRAALLG